MPRHTSLVLASSLSVTCLSMGCTSKPEAPSADSVRRAGAAQAGKVAAPEPGPSGVPVAPSPAEADFAFALAKTHYEAARFEEAEVQLKIASAAGKAEADALLVRVRAEIEAKQRLRAARQKVAAKDYAGARNEIAAMPTDSFVRGKAAELLEEIAGTEDGVRKEISRKVEENLEKESGSEDAGADKKE